MLFFFKMQLSSIFYLTFFDLEFLNTSNSYLDRVVQVTTVVDLDKDRCKISGNVLYVYATVKSAP
jgi:hypothetical protein